MLEHISTREASGIHVHLSQTKTFDRVAHPYLYTVLEAFGFTTATDSLFRALYSDLQCGLSLDRVEVTSFPITRGVRKGCHPSTALFVLYLKPVLIGIRADTRVRCPPLPASTTVTVADYGDDVTLYLCCTVSLDRVLTIFPRYKEISGGLLSILMSKVLCLGDLTDSN